MSGIKEEIEERAADVGPNGQQQIKKEAPDSSFPPFGTVSVRKSIDDVAAPPGIPKRKMVNEEASAGFSPFEMAAVEKKVQSIAPASIPKRKMKEEVLDDDDDDNQIIVLKKKKVVEKHQFMVMNLQTEGKHSGHHMVRMLARDPNLEMSLKTARPLQKIRFRQIYYISVHNDQDAKLIEERIEEMRWMELFCLENLQKENPFFWKPLEDRQLIKAILLATYQQNLGTPPTKTLTQLLDDKNALKAAIGCKLTMKKLKEALNNKSIRILSSIKKEVKRDEAQTVLPGDLQIQPISKIAFHAPFNVMKTNNIILTNSSTRCIAFQIATSNNMLLRIDKPFGVIVPMECVVVTVSCDAFDIGYIHTSNDWINIMWMNTPDGSMQPYRHEWFHGIGMGHWWRMPIEYIA